MLEGESEEVINPLGKNPIFCSI